MATYTLSIEDRVGTGVNVTERAVVVEGSNGFKTEALYNPNKESPFNANSPFDTSFSIVHPMGKVAREIVQQYLADGGVGVPNPIYDSGVNREQRVLFENIIGQETYKAQYEKEEAACRDFLATLPEDRVLERVGFQSRLEEIEQERLKLGIYPYQGNQ